MKELLSSQNKGILAGGNDAMGMAADTIQELLQHQKSRDEVHSLSARLESRENFFALVSHDLRSPLALAKLCSDMIRRDLGASERVKDLSERISKAVDRAELMVRDFLDAKRLEAGLGIGLKIAYSDLNLAIQQEINDLSLVYGERCRYQGHSSLFGNWDGSALRRAVNNLVINGLKYGDERAPVTVHLAEEARYTRISVHNFGQPLTESQLARLFQWHERIHSGDVMNSGWGLGLMLVKGISEAHGGRVEVESSAESGTIFSVVIPREAQRIDG